MIRETMAIQLTPSSTETATALASLRQALDQAVLGQAQPKTGLILAWLASEHAYLEGPAGCGKSLLAEAFARALGASWITLELHRDVRPAELLGGLTLERRRVGSIERLEQRLAPGAAARAELLVLEALHAAPPEARVLLLRALRERRLVRHPLALSMAIATGLPRRAGEPDSLSRVELDAFAIQLRVRGAIQAQDWPQAARILEHTPTLSDGGVLSGHDRRGLQQAARQVVVPGEVRRALVSTLDRVGTLRGADESPLLSDRVFGRAALRLIRAHALLSGRTRARREDLAVLEQMLGCRMRSSDGFDSAADLSELLAEAGARELSPAAGSGITGGLAAPLQPAPERIAAPRRGHLRAETGISRGPAPAAADVELIVRALTGRLERGRSPGREDSGGAPRRRRALRGLDEIFESDPGELAAFLDGDAPAPQVWARERPRAGGRLAVLRDVSASMEGRLGGWAGEIVSGLVRAAERQRRTIGYVEFNHGATLYLQGGRFFHRCYEALRERAARARSAGRTNFQAPLAAALGELGGARQRDAHIVLLTDGLPVAGDPELVSESARARALGVRIHTVFLGLGDPPAILERISSATDGLAFVGRPLAGGRLSVRYAAPSPPGGGAARARGVAAREAPGSDPRAPQAVASGRDR